MVNLWWDCGDFVVNGWSYFGLKDMPPFWIYFFGNSHFGNGFPGHRLRYFAPGDLVRIVECRGLHRLQDWLDLVRGSAISDPRLSVCLSPVFLVA